MNANTIPCSLNLLPTLLTASEEGGLSDLQVEHFLRHIDQVCAHVWLAQCFFGYRGFDNWPGFACRVPCTCYTSLFISPCNICIV